MGPSIKYVTLFLANFDPLPLSHFVTHPVTPRKYVTHLGPLPRFLGGLVQKSRTKVPCTNYISIVRGGFCPGFFVWVGFCPFPLLSQYICYNRKLNITLNFMFHMYDKNCLSVTSHALDPLSCHKLSHLLGPPPPSSVTYFMDGPYWQNEANHKTTKRQKIEKHFAALSFETI